MKKWVFLLFLFLVGCSTSPVEIEEPVLEKPVVEEPVDVEEEVEVVSKEPILVVNKKHGLDPSYAPGEDPVALAAVQSLISDMQSLGMDVSSSYSGFRSYEYQAELYAGYVSSVGQASADTFSARPGYSEHQTGLAFDLKHGDGSLLVGPVETEWLLAHCGEYGLIVRYLEGKEEITGYMAEPWHVRYVGDEATSIMDSGLCLEEYLGVEGGGY